MTKTRIFAFPGTYAAPDAASVTITAAGVNLSDMTVAGNLTIAASVGEGDVRLSNITVQGDLYIEGGGKSSLYLSDVRVEGAVTVRKYEGENTVRIVVSGECNFNAFILETGAILVTQQLQDGTIIPIIIPADFLQGSTFEFIGNFDSIVSNGENAQLIISGSVNKLTLNAPAAITGSGSIATLDVSADAGKGTTSSIRPTSLTGSGKGDVSITAASVTTPSGGGGNGGTTTYTVASFDALSETVNHNAPYTFPSLVTAKLTGGGTRDFAVTWRSEADTSVCGTFVFTGDLTMVSGYVNPNNVTAALALTVRPVLSSISVSCPPAKVLYLKGEALDLTALVVTGSYSDGSTKIETVTLSDVTGYDGEQADGQAQELTINLGGNTATFTVAVYPLVTEGTLVSITNPAAVTAKNGSPLTAAGLNLPPYVVILVDDGENQVETLAAVDWSAALSASAYDPGVKASQSFTLTGDVMLPGTVNDNGAALEANISVTVLAAKYNIVFDRNDQPGASIPNQTIEHGGLIVKPADPTSTSHDFAGWYDNIEGSGDAWDFTAPVTGDVTLYAKWTIKTFTVSFDHNSYDSAENWPDSLSVEYGSKAQKPADPTLEAYTFAGWTLDPAGNSPYDWSAPVTAPVTLYAQFADMLSLAAKALTFDLIKGNNANEQGIMTNLSLITNLTGYPGLSIAWASDNASVIQISGTSGVVHRPAADQSDITVTLTATLTLNGGTTTATKQFALTVRKQGVTSVDVTGIDPLFDSGYPLVSINSDGSLTVKVKLREIPSDAITCYFVIDGMNATYNSPSVQDVLHGHTGNGGRNPENSIVYVNDYGDFLLADADEHLFSTDSSIVRSGRPVKIGFVLAKAGGDTISSAVTLITITPETSAVADTTPPEFYSAYINANLSKIYIYGDEHLNTGSTPAASCFTLEDSTGSETGSVTGVQLANSPNNEFVSWIVLSVSGVTRADVDSGIKIKYTQPNTNALKDLAGNEVGSGDLLLYDEIVEFGQAEIYSAYINPSKGSAIITFRPSINFQTSDFPDTDALGRMFTIYNGSSPVTVTNYDYAYSNSGSDCEMVFTFAPISSAGAMTWSFTPAGRLQDVAGDAITPLTGQPFTEVISGASYSTVSAEYRRDNQFIMLTFTDSLIGTPYDLAACNFVLQLDNVSYRLRGFNVSVDAGNGVIIIWLEKDLALKLEAAQSVSLYYSNIHQSTHYGYLVDLAEAEIEAFGPITVPSNNRTLH